MSLENKYVVKHETVLFLPKYNQYGNPSTVVMEESAPFEVSMHPKSLIDYNLKYYGSSLQGARDGAKAILGEVRMYPVVINEKLDIFWFPSKSVVSADCIWFALHHLRDYAAIDSKNTKVLLSNGSTVSIETSIYSFDKKVQRAYKLRGKIAGRTGKSPSAGFKTCYHIVRKAGVLNYELNVIGEEG